MALLLEMLNVAKTNLVNQHTSIENLSSNEPWVD